MSSAFNIPAGFALVPLEPTVAMKRAGLAERHDDLSASIYKAMLAAAPTPPIDAVPGEPVAQAWVYRLNMLESCANWLESRSRCVTLNIKADPIEGGGYESLMRKYAEDLRTIRSILAASVASRAGSEPVAWRWRYDSAKRWVLTEKPMNPGDEYEVQPLYAIAPAAAAEPSERAASLVASAEMYLGLCLDEDRTLHATVMRKEANGGATVLLSDYVKMPKGQDVIMRFGAARSAGEAQS